MFVLRKFISPLVGSLAIQTTGAPAPLALERDDEAGRLRGGDWL